ncbi:hypothetical protein V6Z11_D06G063300 [Gossypium hirsutum]|uniref:Uncharacterized protein isoform X2 n=1 Tax=Gossypium hirsutum TaxID=3635 RepID=A0ABM3A8J3_GOSHI|nr:uncharacterized protein LOC121218279 isoform X2 [Gossypium hirsutum]
MQGGDMTNRSSRVAERLLLFIARLLILTPFIMLVFSIYYNIFSPSYTLTIPMTDLVSTYFRLYYLNRNPGLLGFVMEFALSVAVLGVLHNNEALRLFD